LGYAILAILQMEICVSGTAIKSVKRAAKNRIWVRVPLSNVVTRVRGEGRRRE
jgi:hypothetical protein